MVLSYTQHYQFSYLEPSIQNCFPTHADDRFELKKTNCIKESILKKSRLFHFDLAIPHPMYNFPPQRN